MIGNRQKRFPIFNMLLRISEKSYNFAADFRKWYLRLFFKGALREVYIFSKRVECWRNNDREKYGHKAMVDFAWYVFQKGYKGYPVIRWL